LFVRIPGASPQADRARAFGAEQIAFAVSVS